MAKYNGNDPVHIIGSAVCEALGLKPDNVVGFTLTVRVNDIVRIEVDMVPQFDPADLQAALANVDTKRFEIREVGLHHV